MDIATDPQFDGEHIDEGGVIPGPIMALQVASSSDGFPPRERIKSTVSFKIMEKIDNGFRSSNLK